MMIQAGIEHSASIMQKQCHKLMIASQQLMVNLYNVCRVYSPLSLYVHVVMQPKEEPSDVDHFEEQATDICTINFDPIIENPIASDKEKGGSMAINNH